MRTARRSASSRIASGFPPKGRCCATTSIWGRSATPDGRRLAVACGRSAAEFIDRLLQDYPVAGANITVYALENTWFGPTVTVSGLITGKDLTEQMAGIPCDAIMITEVMLRDGSLFLDDMTLDEAIQRLGKPVVPVGRRGEDLLRTILTLAGEETGNGE